MLGHNPLYKVKNPFSWMLMISLENKTNFFEKRVTEYAKAQKTGDVKLIEDF
jgi:ribonucleoside-diphosphate reductase subunit M2